MPPRRISLQAGICLLAALLLSGCIPNYIFKEAPPSAQYETDRQRNDYRVQFGGPMGYEPPDQLFTLRPGETVTLAQALKKLSGGKLPAEVDAPQFNHIILWRFEHGEMVKRKLKYWDSPHDAAFPIEAGDVINIPDVVD